MDNTLFPNFHHLAAFFINCDYLKFRAGHIKNLRTGQDILNVCNIDRSAAQCYMAPYSFIEIIKMAVANGKVNPQVIEAYETINANGPVVEPSPDLATGFGLFMECAAFINDKTFVDEARLVMSDLYGSTFADEMFDNINDESYKIPEGVETSPEEIMEE